MKKVHFRGFKLIRLKVNQNSTASPQSNQRARNEPQRGSTEMDRKMADTSAI